MVEIGTVIEIGTEAAENAPVVTVRKTTRICGRVAGAIGAKGERERRETRGDGEIEGGKKVRWVASG